MQSNQHLIAKCYSSMLRSSIAKVSVLFCDPNTINENIDFTSKFCICLFSEKKGYCKLNISCVLAPDVTIGRRCGIGLRVISRRDFVHRSLIGLYTVVVYTVVR